MPNFFFEFTFNPCTNPVSLRVFIVAFFDNSTQLLADVTTTESQSVILAPPVEDSALNIELIESNTGIIFGVSSFFKKIMSV